MTDTFSLALQQFWEHLKSYRVAAVNHELSEHMGILGRLVRVCYLFSLGSLCLEITHSPLNKMSQLAKYGQVHTAAQHKTKQYNPVADHCLAPGSLGSVVYDP